MCGIAGIVRFDDRPIDEAVLRRMCDRIAPRGPDEHGIHVDGRVGLGHRRLAIIDLSSGQQPMRSADGALVVVYNGEIYNHELLRTELEQRGRTFRTTCDTEVLLHLYAEHGPDFVDRLRGMFAFALWDARERRVLFARDRVGIKPLHYAVTPRAFVFGSELKAVMAAGEVGGDLDPHAIDDYFAHGFIRGERTIFEGVRKLRPGRTMLLEVGGSGPPTEIAQRRFWSLPDPTPLGAPAPDYETAKAELEARLLHAVRIRLMAEVPLGAFLSGGIDSSTTVWLMARASSTPVRTFSIGFSEAAFDELAYARAVSRRFGTQHEEEVVTPDAVAVLPRVIAAHDEPFGDPSSIPTWYLSRMARKHVTVCLSGDGGDELFAGYTRYGTVARERARIDALPGAVARALSALGALAPMESRARNLLDRLAADPEAQYARFRAIFSPAMRRRLFRPELQARTDPAATGRLFEDLTPAMRAALPAARLQMADFHTYLPEDVLVKVDRMSMTHALEVRVPLLDHLVVEYVQRLPLDFKLRGGTTKRILRDIVAPHLPDEVLGHRKQGFSVPLAAWFRNELRTELRDAVAGPVLRDSGLFEARYLDRLYRMHQSGWMDLSWQLWQLLVFHHWLEGTRPTLAA